jgi:hypothetical protein
MGTTVLVKEIVDEIKVVFQTTDNPKTPDNPNQE